MGLLRILLAAAVVVEHSTPIFGVSLTGGNLAVRLFFIISGFYMTMILDRKYTSDCSSRYWLFISNRFLRIYPSYYVILILSLLFYAAASFYLNQPADRLLLWQSAWSNNHFLDLVVLGISQLTIVGMDAICLFVYNIAQGVHLPCVNSVEASVDWLPVAGANPLGTVPAFRFLFVPQSWSISIELLFYLAVPFLVSWRNRSLAILATVSFLSYLVRRLFVPPALVDPFGYFFFPFHLFLFILGMMAYRYSGIILASVSRSLRITLITALFIVLLFSQFMPLIVRNPVCIAMVSLSLPILFVWSRDSSFHRLLGDLSYPVYICHILVKWGLLAVMGVSKKGVTSPPGWLLLTAAILMAILMLWLCDYPIDRWRQRRLLTHKGDK